MIELKRVNKVYETGDTTIKALDDVSIEFREKEFVSIVGESGSGKTTFLNVVGGLMQYDSGDFLIQGKSTANFDQTDWDSYRNNSVGFIFQNYHLIPHLSVLANVEMGMTLSGIDADKRSERATELLERVGLDDHINKKPNQLSGGQQQRVAIARALANDPDIILADEPTGALDSGTSVEIMDLLKEISKDKLIVMVTHSQDLADEYSDRVVRFSDGKIIGDSKPYDSSDEYADYKLNPTGMSFWTALKLSAQNIMTKKGRTAVTAIASSIGIIGVAAVLALSNGMNNAIEEFESDSMSAMPITIDRQTISINNVAQTTETLGSDYANMEEYPNTSQLYTSDMLGSLSTLAQENNISQEYLDYLTDMNPEYLQATNISYNAPLHLLKENTDGEVVELEASDTEFRSYPTTPTEGNSAYLENQFDLLEGSWPVNANDLLLVVNEYNQVDQSILDALQLPSSEEMEPSDFLGQSYQLIMNDDYYQTTEIGGYRTPTDEELTDIYEADSNQTIEISGIIRPKEDGNIAAELGFVYFDRSLKENLIENTQSSQIVQDQEDSDVNLMTGQPFAEEGTEETSTPQTPAMPAGGASQATSGIPELTKDEWMTALGATATPSSIELFPNSFEFKDEVLNHLNAWNENHGEEEQVIYNDLASVITSLAGGIITAITWILVAFAAISLVVSVIMMGIIVYSSVMERTGEIGILRALGARQKDITRVFNAETFIIGLLSGVIGIAFIYLISPMVNSLIVDFSGVEGVFSLNPLHAVGLVIISLLLTLLGGYIPARMASKMDPVEALNQD